MHENSILLFQQHALPFFAEGMKVLEIGPNGFPSTYQKMISAPNLVWETLDISASPKLTYPKSDLYHFSIPENHYDIVLSGQVIEHVANIWRWMKELSRVTKPGGLVITVNPISWPYHESPIDCWRIYPEGMKALSEDAGLVVEKSFWGTLESPHLRPFWEPQKSIQKRSRFRHVIPGRSLQQQPKIYKFLSPILARFGGRVEKSFDNITIARKPIRENQP
jgi:ubiquinone/menaquinone biosynthesis C-methylase UbiE